MLSQDSQQFCKLYCRKMKWTMEYALRVTKMWRFPLIGAAYIMNNDILMFFFVNK